MTLTVGQRRALLYGRVGAMLKDLEQASKDGAYTPAEQLQARVAVRCLELMRGTLRERLNVEDA